jgi:hypothetical protein
MIAFILKTATAASGLAFLACVATSEPASAVTVELAKKCRAMMVEAHPPKPAGSIEGNAQEERSYFRTCLTLGGKMGNPPDSTVGIGR